MKLAAKLTAFILAAILLVFVFRGVQSARRQMANAEHRVRENAILVGRVLRPALEKASRTSWARLSTSSRVVPR